MLNSSECNVLSGLKECHHFDRTSFPHWLILCWLFYFVLAILLWIRLKEKTGNEGSSNVRMNQHGIFLGDLQCTLMVLYKMMMLMINAENNYTFV